MNEAAITQSVLVIVKLFLLALIALFIVFSFIVIRQVQLMTRVLTVPISPTLKTVAFGLVLYSVGIFIVAFIAL